MPIESDEDLQKLYSWVDELPLSRPKKNISRDFSDGVLYAEILHSYFPKLVELHNYSAANSEKQKVYNWNTLNSKVCKKLGYSMHAQDISDVISAQPGAIERVLKVLQDKIKLVQKSPGDRTPTKGPPVGGARGSSPLGAPGSAGGASTPNAGVGRSARDAKVQQYQAEVDTELLVEKEQTISELREMVVIMSEKIKKLEQLVRIKDSKIEALGQKLQKYGLT